ncbi:hypothetical protein A0U92_03675 [Acetobacter aceti]|uniref:Uncharacterized protein n=1 Tax=Acetobacter aceti TaxID=435 RepID=A0A1U9KE36_ACEAC|nr:hypothetical protein [Acetobacter aceti]AQS84018.1 hypothetical protein A0U92_03675 [Acetobacter aceti]
MSGLNISQFKREIVTPVVGMLNLPGDGLARIQLHTGIDLAESGLASLRQSGGGPALGIGQMEEDTHNDIWKTFLSSRPALAQIVRGFMPARFNPNGVDAAGALVESLTYSVAMSCMRFYRSSVLLPPRNSAIAQCHAWKMGYNTPSGAGRVDAEHIALFSQAIAA